MVLDNLGESLRNALQKVARSMFVDDAAVNELIKELQRALLQSDVNVKLVFSLSQRIKERILKEETPGGLTKREFLVKVVYEELVKFLGGEESQLDASAIPTIIMLSGLFGSGKTTTAAKLARYFSKRGLKVAMVQLDVYRPAALDQLQQLGKQIGVPVFGNKSEKDPLKIFSSCQNELRKFDVVIVDTAGRDALSAELIAELKAVAAAVQPNENLLVISADIGQAAERQATAFHDACKITGVIVTKLEGTAKGGGALSACSVSGAPIKFVGVGEKIEDMEKFNPKGFVGRLLGMGDIEALLEKANEAVTEEEAKDMSEKFLKGEFTLLDLYEQMQAIKKMGPIAKVMEMIPGFGQLKLPKDVLDVQEANLKKWKFAMDSMTKKELEDPEAVTSDRIERIAKGSGIGTGEVKDLLKQYRQSKKVVKMFKGASPKKMQQMIGKMGGMKGMEGLKG
ncbi:signal recognition particle protein [Candidatus Woesearchaeota archaeon]|nr:signal recognition particle protein [Candidatus Woesearchaeota archaeon]